MTHHSSDCFRGHSKGCLGPGVAVPYLVLLATCIALLFRHKRSV